ncbi:MAG: hypothetical protein WBD36_10160 [Bacteroidota bacterium]
MKIQTAVLLVVLATGCSKETRETTKQEEQTPGRQYAQVPITALDPDKMVPVGSCRIVGTVLAVDTTELQANGDGPCSKAPCVAKVRIDSILGTGSSFARPLAVGSAVRVRFAYTLSPSKELFPRMDPPLPGLLAGTQFKAFMQSSAESSTYSVETYDIHQN